MVPTKSRGGARFGAVKCEKMPKDATKRLQNGYKTATKRLNPENFKIAPTSRSINFLPPTAPRKAIRGKAWRGAIIFWDSEFAPVFRLLPLKMWKIAPKMTEFAPEMPVKSALVPMGAEIVRRCSSVPSRREGAHFGAGLIHPGQCKTSLRGGPCKKMGMRDCLCVAKA